MTLALVCSLNSYDLGGPTTSSREISLQFKPKVVPVTDGNKCKSSNHLKCQSQIIFTDKDPRNMNPYSSSTNHSQKQDTMSLERRKGNKAASLDPWTLQTI